MVTPPGLEPEMTGPKPVVLPITPRGNYRTRRQNQPSAGGEYSNDIGAVEGPQRPSRRACSIRESRVFVDQA